MAKPNSISLMIKRHLFRMSVLALLLVSGLGYSTYRLYQTQTGWDQALEQRDPRLTAVSRLRHHLGYGGLIHNYLNSILRPDETFGNSTLLDVGAAHGALLEFETLKASPIERSALATIRAELDIMRSSVQQRQRGELAGKTPEEVYALSGVNIAHLANSVQMLVSASSNNARDTVTHLELMSALEGAMGLDGLIHHLKAYVLTRDPAHMQKAKAATTRAHEVLEQLATRATSPAEREAIRVIDATVGEYAAAIATARDMAVQGATASQVDQAVRVDDAAALSGYATLISFETERLQQQMDAVGSGIITTRFIVMVLIIVFVVPFCMQFVRVCIGLLTIVPEWARTITTIGNNLAGEEFEKSADYGTLPSELAAVEEPFTAIRRTLWFRREQALEAEAQIDQIATENEHLIARVKMTTHDLEAATLRADEALAEAGKVRDQNALMGSVMGALSNGVLATHGFGELLFWNPRLAELIDVPLEWFSPERTLSDLILYLATRGDFGQGDPIETAGRIELQISQQLDEGIYAYDQTFPGSRVAAIEMVRRENGTIVFSANDITERHKHATDMERRAVSDPLTGLANRTALDDFTNSMLKHTKRAGETAAILALDLDGFKPINDKLGHGAGDETLIELARRLREEIRETDFVARTGGDEFIVVLLHLEDAESAARFAHRLLRAIEVPINITTGEVVQVTGSIGVAVFPDDTEDPGKLYRKADEALYGAKAAGRNCVKTYLEVTNHLYADAASGI